MVVLAIPNIHYINLFLLKEFIPLLVVAYASLELEIRHINWLCEHIPIVLFSSLFGLVVHCRNR